MKKKVLASLVVLAGLGFPGSAAAAQQPGLPENVKTIIKNSCGVSGCHQGKYPASNHNFEPDKFLSSVLDVPSLEVPGKKLIDTADPEASYLLSKIKGEPGIVGQRMPAGGRDPLPADEIGAIEAWIVSLKNSSPGPAASTGAAKASPGKIKRPAFWGTRIINLPTSETIDKGHVLFRISHRFYPPVSIGWKGFYGLDGPAFVLLSFGYAVTDALMVTVGRTNEDQEWEFYADYRLFGPSGDSGFPLSGALHIGGSVVSAEKPAGEVWSGRFRFSGLFSLSWKATDRISLLVEPGYASNTNFMQPDSEGTFSLGVGGRLRLFDDFSVIGEWVPALAGFKAFANGWGLGLEKKIGGHVFQLFVNNNYGLTAAQYLVGGELGQLQTRFFDRFRLGFNIFRTF